MSSMNDLRRFLEAQQRDHAIALTEIKAGNKRSHWMWYIFPQIEGLGYSEMAKRFAIKDLAEASEYLAHPVLGPRLQEIASALLDLKTSNANQVMGAPDDLKLRSSMTLDSCCALRIDTIWSTSAETIKTLNATSNRKKVH